MARTKRTSVALDSIQSALASLAVIADSEDARILRERCVALQAAVEGWKESPPTAEERETMMRKILGVHVAVTRLRKRSMPPAT